MWRGLPHGMGVKLALGLCVLLLSARQSIAQYQCGDPTDGGHCYGTAFWRERLNYAGASTTISQVPMGCPSGCDGFINNEMWLVDYDMTLLAQTPLIQSSEMIEMACRPELTRSTFSTISGPRDTARHRSVIHLAQTQL